jgi:hypothetical protein
MAVIIQRIEEFTCLFLVASAVGLLLVVLLLEGDAVELLL